MAGNILLVVVPDVELIAMDMSMPLSRVSALKTISVDASGRVGNVLTARNIASCLALDTF
jgi:hypothetical protein